MTFGTNSVTINVGETPKVLVKINQDSFGSQYYLREAAEEFTLNCRHSQEGLLPDGSRFDRHNVEIIHTTFATDTSPERVRVSYAVFRNKRSDDYDEAVLSMVSLTSLLDEATIEELLAWRN